MDNRYRRRCRSIRTTIVCDLSGRSPGDRALPRFPPEPPSLARATPEGRATAAQEGSASLWWVRASARLARWAPWMLDDMPERKSEKTVPEPSGVVRAEAPHPTALQPLPSAQGSSHASPPRPVSVGEHDATVTVERRGAPRVEVGNFGVGAADVPGTEQQWSAGQSETTTAERQRPYPRTVGARFRHHNRNVGDSRSLLLHDHAADASSRATGCARARPAAVRTDGRGGFCTTADGRQLDGADQDETWRDCSKDSIGQSGTER